MGEFRPFQFRDSLDGISRSVLNREAAESLFRNGRLTAADPVSYLDDEGERISVPADEASFLADLFAATESDAVIVEAADNGATESDVASTEIDTSEIVAEPNPDRTSEVVGEVPPRSAASGPLQADIGAMEAVEKAPAIEIVYSTPGPPRGETGGKQVGWFIGAGLLLLLIIARCTNNVVKVAPVGPPVSPDIGANNQVDANREVSEDLSRERAPVSPGEISNSVTWYAIRQTNVRAQPDSTSPTVGSLDRGTAVNGVIVAGNDPRYGWMKVTGGPNAGYFVAQSNLSAIPRPALDTSSAGQMTVTSEAQIYSEPTSPSRILGTASRGVSMRVIGMTQDGRAEVSLRNGEIGYVDIAAFRDEPIQGAPAGEQAPPPESPTRPILPPSTPRAQVYESPRQQANQARPPRLLNPSWLSDNDYPAASVRSGEEGTARFVAIVSANGRVFDCRITASSGHRRLDDQTCRLFAARARFDPATDGDGKPISGPFSGQTTWRLARED